MRREGLGRRRGGEMKQVEIEAMAGVGVRDSGIWG